MPCICYATCRLLSKVIHRIRFPLMTHTEFNENVVCSYIVSGEEYMSILKCISSPVKEGSDFDCKPRKTYSISQEKVAVPRTLVKDVTELKCMAIKRPDKELTQYFYYRVCRENVCFVCASMCHGSGSCADTDNRSTNGYQCNCKSTHKCKLFKYIPV